MPESSQYTRWRNLNDQVDAFDPITPDGPRYVGGHLPAGFVLLLFDGNALRGPMKFNSQKEADDYLLTQPGVKGFIIIPRYDA